MNYSLCIWFCVLLAALLVTSLNPVSGSGEFEQQPKIRVQDGSLLLEAVRDRNITLRMTGNAALMFGDINMIDLIKTKLAPIDLTPDQGDVTRETMRALKRDMLDVKHEIENFHQSLLRMENDARTSRQHRQITRYIERATRLLVRIDAIEAVLTIDECTAGNQQPCRNGGECYDGYKDFRCECPEGWTGKTCEEDVDECYYFAGTALGCQNNGVCVNTLGSYRCVCNEGYSGTHCRLKHAICESAQSAELCGHGVCVPNKSVYNYTCICDQGWTTNNATPTCNVDVDECAMPMNPCHSECINLPGDYKCGACPRGFSGDGVMCTDVNECATNNGGCSLQPKVTCINTEGSYRCGRCPPGWTGDGHTCTQKKTNNCDAEGICHPLAKCQYISGTAVCTCPAGMYGHGFSDSGCSGTIPAVSDPCAEHHCKNNGLCVVIGRGTRCSCPAGYMGPLCEQEEACHSSPCQGGGTCNQLANNKFSCSCPPGSTGVHCEIVRSTCGNIIRQEEGEFHYPPIGASLTYEAFERCAWIIRTHETKVLNITFERFDLEESHECNHDWLQIHDGRTLAAQMIGRFCGKTLPLGGSILSSHNQLFFWFRSDNTTHGSGFKFTWRSQEHVCGGDIDLDNAAHTLVRSPGYPGQTPAGRECEWKISAPFGQRLVLRFYQITLGAAGRNGSNGTCTQDTVKVYDSDRLLRELCESARPEPLHTASNQVVVHYHTDSHGADSSFQLHVEVEPGIPNCGGLYTERSGVIMGYMNADVCLYLIQQPVGTKIELQFTTFDLMTSDDCHMQRIEVYDGRTDDDPLLKVLCGNQTNLEPLVSESNYMLVRYEFALAGFQLNKRFEAKYKRVCVERYFGPSIGTITTPNYPKPYYEHLKCVYHMYGPIDSVVSINITDFSLSESIPVDDSIAEEDINFVDVYLSKENRRRYYKSDPTHLVSERNYMRIDFNGATNSRRARGLRIEYAFDIIKCGGVLTERNDTISHRRSRKTEECEWIIEAAEGEQIKLSIMIFRPIRCRDEDLVFIYDNSGQLLARYGIYGRYDRCRFQTQDTFTFNMIRIVYNMSLQDVYIPQILEFNYQIVTDSESCGGDYNARYGVITSPSWPKPYGGNLNCTWIIRAPMGNQIELRVQNFSVEPSFGKCTADVLRIRNGKYDNSPLIGEYCGNSIPAQIPSFGNGLHLHFRSDASVGDSGFKIIWVQTNTGCGGKLNSHIGAIHSPHYADVDAGRVVCEWHITTSEGTTIDIQLNRVNENNNLCNEKMFVVYDGPISTSRPLKFNCTDDVLNIELHATGNDVLVRYTVDESADEGLEFLLEYNTNCNVIIADQLQGVIESPNFPDPYPPSITCLWDIRSAKSNKLMLAFSHLQVEMRDGQCENDYVEVIDMRDDVVLSRRKLCEVPVDAVTSDGNRLQVHFVSDFTDVRSGFRAEFKRLGCGEHRNGYLGVINSPNAPYSVNVDCSWYIEVEAGKQIRLKFYELHIETDSPDCKTDSIIVAESINSNTTLLHECQIEQMPITITTPGNQVYIRFLTSEKRARKYFKLSYIMIDSQCGGEFHAARGVIASPNYPSFFAADVNCEWDLSVDYNYYMRIKIDELELQVPSNDCTSYLQVRKENSNEHVIQFCGPDPPMDHFEISNNRALINFRIKPPNAKGKFLLHYERSCSRNITNTEGFLKALPSESCNWTINAAEGTHISIDILHLQCQCANEISCRGVTFHPSSTLAVNETIAAFDFCQNHQTNIIVPSNSLTIEAQNVNFRARYSTLQSSCGGVLSSLQGYLVSPYYPKTYPPNVECTWTIEAAHGSFLEISLEVMDIAMSEHCNGDYLEIRAGEIGKLLGTFCGQEVPTDPLLVYEKVWIKFRSIEGSTGNGFKLHWNHAHTNELNATSGEIVVPPIIAARQQELNYAWRIMIARGQFISIQFLEYIAGLNLYDGFDSIALRVEIPDSTWTFISSSNVVYLTTINSDLEYFKIVWTAINTRSYANDSDDQCINSYVLSNNEEKSISSPGFPHGYAHNLNCSWVLKPADNTQHLVFKLHAMDVEDRPDCSMDYVKVSTSADLQIWDKQLLTCGSKNQTNDTVVIGTPAIKVEFKSDVSVNGSGFTSTVYSTCGANITGSYGAILATQVEQYQMCKWHINVKASTRIIFNFQYENSDNNKDYPCNPYVLIYDGIDEYAPILKPGQICTKADRAVKTLETTGNHAVIKYIRDRYNIYHWGLNITYKAIGSCEDEIRLNDQLNAINISTPRYPDVPHPHTECTWIFIGPVGETLQVDFIDFDLNRRYCEEEYVEIFDGSTILARRLGHYCRKPTKSLRSTGNILLIHYLTDIVEPRAGFRAQVAISECGGFYFDTEGTVASQNYPAPGGYPRMSTCEYTIQASHARLSLNFSDLHLPYDAQNLNSSDRIEVIQLENNEVIESAKYFGNITKMPLIETESNEVRIRFTTYQGGSQYRGFQLRYNRIGGSCFRDATGEQGTLSIRSFYGPSYHICRWRITVPKGQNVRLELIDVNLNTNSPPSINQTQYVRKRLGKMAFYNDISMLSKIIEFNITDYNSSMAVVESTDNFMFIVIELADGREMIKARYTSFDESPCPPEIGDSASGRISIENLRNHRTFYCELPFTSVPNETISFRINTIKITHRTDPSRSTFAVRFRDKRSFFSHKAINTNETNMLVSLSAERGAVDFLQNDAVGLLQFTADYKRHACGGTMNINTDNLVLEYPNIVSANNEYGVLECIWSVRNPRNIQLLGNINLKNSCASEYIIIYAGAITASSQLTRICRDQTPPFNSLILDSPFTTIVYHTDNYRPGESNFRFTSEKVMPCGGKLQVYDQSQQIKVDNKLYKNNTECVWEYEVVRGLYLSVHFTGRFFIENSPNCSKDYVEIQGYNAGLWLPEGRFCGRDVQTVFNSTSNRIQVIFRTDDTITADGFQFFVTASCNRIFNVTDTPQTINSPQFRRQQVRRCEYMFITDTDKVIAIRLIRSSFLPISRLDANRIDCNQKLFQSTKTDAYGNIVNSDVLCNVNDVVYAYNNMTLRFNIRMRTAVYTLQYELSACGGNVTTPILISPTMHGHNDGYVDNMRCMWYITAPPDHSVVVRFKYFDMEYHVKCEFDALEIFAGSIYGQNVISKLCGEVKSPEQLTVMVDNRYAVLAAISDGSGNNHKGFAADIIFTRNCNERISLNLGNTPVTLTRQLEFNASETLLCNYKIITSPGYKISVEFKQLNLNSDTSCTADRCGDCNHFQLHDSIAAERASMGKYCVQSANNITLTSSSEDLVLTLEANRPGQYHFEIELQIEKTLCDIENNFDFKTDQTLNIIFPPTIDYPLYPPNTHCRWRVTGSSNVQILFKMFELQNASQVTGKCSDYVTFETAQYRSTDSKQFCGNATGYFIEKIISSGNPLEIIFHSDTEIEAKGFHIILRASTTCNQTHTITTGYYLNYESTYGLNTIACIDEVRVPANYTLNFYISSLFFRDDNCNNTYLKIIDVNNNKTLLNQCDNIYNSQSLLTTTNAVQIHAENFNYLNIFYTANNASMPPGCGGRIFSERGEISNPAYNIEDHTWLTCEWQITVPTPNRIKFTFVYFNMGSAARCDFDFMHIESVRPTGTVAHNSKFCGSDYQPDYVTTTSSARLIAQKTPNFDGLGWRIIFSSDSNYEEKNFVHL